MTSWAWETLTVRGRRLHRRVKAPADEDLIAPPLENPYLRAEALLERETIGSPMLDPGRLDIGEELR